MASPKNLSASFYDLSSDQVLDCVERALDRTQPNRRATGSILALNSLENRVYQIEFEDGLKVVSKFYRPNRWSSEQIEEEHRFLKKLLTAEVPVIAPLDMANGRTLSETPDGIYFTVFPYTRGRLLDELTPTHLQTLGRYLGRIHRMGSQITDSRRLRLDTQTFGWDPLDLILDSPFFETDAIAAQYEDTAVRVLEAIEPLFQGMKYILVHGDCHLGNTLWQGENPFFLDFDDLCLAPAVQDIWMIVRGRDDEADEQRDILLESYEQMNEFNGSELSLIEPLRALRIIHYSSWIAKRWEDPSFPKAFPLFGTTRYWHDEISELEAILSAIQEGGYE